MELKITFSTVKDLDIFFNDFVDSIDSMSISAIANIKDKTVILNVLKPKQDQQSFTDEKILVNDIKQYMRDNEISYDISV